MGKNYMAKEKEKTKVEVKKRNRKVHVILMKLTVPKIPREVCAGGYSKRLK